MLLTAQDSRIATDHCSFKENHNHLERKYQQQTLAYPLRYVDRSRKNSQANFMLQSLILVANVAGNMSNTVVAAKIKVNQTNVIALSHALIPKASLETNYPPLALLPAVVNLTAVRLDNHDLSYGGQRPFGIRQFDEGATPRANVHRIRVRSPIDLPERENNSVVAQTRRLVNWLMKQNITPAGDEVTGIFPLVDQCIEHLRDYPQSMAFFARELCKPTGEYGSYINETLTENSQFRIFSQWVESIVFQPSLSEFIARAWESELRHNGSSSTYSASIVYSAVMKRFDATENSFHCNELPVERQGLKGAAKDYILRRIVFPIMPTLQLSTNTMSTSLMDVGSIDWVHFNVGLSFTNSLEIKDISLSNEDLLQLGRSLEEMLTAEAIDPEAMNYFDFPAKLFYFRQQIEAKKTPAIDEIFNGENATSIALEAFLTASEKYKIDQSPMGLLSTALGQFKTRSQFPGEPEQSLESFKLQNEDIAKKYKVVDKLLLWQMLSGIDPGELDFIVSSKVRKISAICSAFDSLKHQAVVKHLLHESYTINLLPDVDLITAERGNEKRIFALRPTKKGYHFQRVDQRIELYYQLMSDAITCKKDPSYKLKIFHNALNAPLLKNELNDLEWMIDELVNMHAQRLLAQLHLLGYEATTWEKVRDFLLSMVPLYDCITGILAERHEAALACATDLFSFAPFVGRSAGMAAKFAKAGVMGGILSLRASAGSLALRVVIKDIIRDSGAGLIRHAATPAAQVLNRRAMVALGVSAIRTLDPGFELMGIVGVKATHQLAQLAKAMGNRVQVWKKIHPWVERRVIQIDSMSLEAEYLTGRLVGLDKDLPVVRLGGDQLSGQDIYVRFNPSTGDVFGRKYTLTPERYLHAVPIPLARRLHNILEQGLSGKGAPGAAKNFAAKQRRKPYVRIVAADIAEWVASVIKPNHQDMWQFIGQRGFTYDRWRRYVNRDGTITLAGCTLLQNHDPAAWNSIINFPPELQLKVLGNSNTMALYQNVGPIPSTSQNANLQSIVMQNVIRQETLRKEFFSVWDAWASQGDNAEARLSATVKLKLCLINFELVLDLSGLSLRSLPPVLPKQVAKLNLNNNRLTALPYALPPKLSHLDISHNSFAELPIGLPNSLIEIIVHHNQIRHLFLVMPELLLNFDASYNQIENAGQVFGNGLSYLNLGYNRLTQMPSLAGLKLLSLNIEFNLFNELPALPNTLSILHAAGNQLNILPGIMPLRISFIDVSFNRLRDVQLLLLRKLKRLKIDSNLLSTIPNPLPPNLLYLSAGKNVITSLPSNWPSKLRALLLEDNLISTLEGTTFPSTLLMLNLNKNLITSLLDNQLNEGLERVYLAKNSLVGLPARLPGTLRLIDVSENQIMARPAHLAAAVEFINGT